MKGVLPWLVHWARRFSTGDLCPALAALVSLYYKIFVSLPYTTYFTLFVPHCPAIWVDSRAASPVSKLPSLAETVHGSEHLLSASRKLRAVN